jgi:Zn-dependent M28 family amino/carboxypeptidase
MKIKLFFVVSFLILLGSCSKPKPIEINSEEILEDVKTLSNDSLEGRAFSKTGNYKAQKFIEEKFRKIGLQTIAQNGYLQEFDYNFQGKKRQKIFPIKNPKANFSNVSDTIATGGNIIGMLKGQINKTIVITAHYDHLGIIDGRIYNGADDNASGTAALFAIAEYFKTRPTRHNLIIAAVDAEEIGSLGAEYFLNNYSDKNNISLNINLDMISHSDYDPELFACGLFHYPELRRPLERAKSEKIVLLFGHDDPENKEQSDWTFTSDHRVFHREKIPFIYFGVEDHKDYHRHTDNFATINTDFYIEAIKTIIRSIENFDEFLND